MNWMPAFGFEGDYEVSDQGHIRHLRPRKGSPAHLKALYDRDGYVRVSIGRPQMTVRLHRLIWQTFKGEIPSGHVINHLNGVKNDNRLENLEVCTVSQNTQHGYRVLGRKPPKNPNHGEDNGRSKLTDEDVHQIRLMIAKGDGNRKIAALFAISHTAVWWIRNGATWRE